MIAYEFRMIRHIDFNGDQHKAIRELNEVRIDLNQWETTGQCPHKPSGVLVMAKGDLADRVANGVYCRYCGERLKIKSVVWELESPIPTRPQGAA